jgi:hypothetical protein
MLLVLQSAGIKIKRSSYSVPPQISGFMETTPITETIEELSSSEEEEENEEEEEKKTQKYLLQKTRA